MIFGMGAAMGWTVHDVKAASMWEFFAAWHGYIEANTPKDNKKLSESEIDALADIVDGLGSSGPRTLSTQTYWWEGDWPEPAGIVTFTVN